MLMSDEVFYLLLFVLFIVALLIEVLVPFPVMLTLSAKSAWFILVSLVVIIAVAAFLRLPKFEEDDDE